MACSAKKPSLHTKVILPVAFLIKFPLLLATNMDMFCPLLLICCISKAPVASSAAIPCTAQYMELNGFWLIQRCFTVTTHLFSSNSFTRTPHIKADGNLKNTNLLRFDTEIFISNDLVPVKIIKIGSKIYCTTHLIKIY